MTSSMMIAKGREERMREMYISYLFGIHWSPIISLFQVLFKRFSSQISSNDFPLGLSHETNAFKKLKGNTTLRNNGFTEEKYQVVKAFILFVDFWFSNSYDFNFTRYIYAYIHTYTYAYIYYMCTYNMWLFASVRFNIFVLKLLGIIIR